MGVYINMEMPESCIKCKLCVSYKCVLTGEIRWSDEFDYDNKRFENCPLIPIPAHGRLIDVDALSAKLNMMLSMAFGEGNTAFHFAYRSLGKVVENAPTIIPAETLEEE